MCVFKKSLFIIFLRIFKYFLSSSNKPKRNQLFGHSYSCCICAVVQSSTHVVFAWYMPFSANQTEEPTPAQAETITPTLYVWEKCAKKKPIPSSNTFCVKICKKVCFYLPIIALVQSSQQLAFLRDFLIEFTCPYQILVLRI